MPTSSDRRSLFVIFSVIFTVAISTYLVILFARGYRIEFQKEGPTIQSTGILSLTSKPKGASVYINDQLTTATDDNLALSPGDYNVKIIKDGYLPWSKNYTIKKEVVFQTDAQLFRSAPELRPLTYNGAINPVSSPDGTKIIYSVASASVDTNNGLYLIETSNPFLPTTRNLPRQLSPDLAQLKWSDSTYIFSPDSKKILTSTSNQSFLVNLDTPTSGKSIQPLSVKEVEATLTDWGQIESQIITNRLDQIPVVVQNSIASESAKNIQVNTSEDKIIYLAQTNTSLPQQIITPPPAQNTQPQQRDLLANHYYVYDLKDDTNYLLGNKQDIALVSWLPGSNNILLVETNHIKIADSDNTNKTTIFTGNFVSTAVFPWSDGNQIVTLTSAYTPQTNNLYSIKLK